jgi:hypothetical protein
MTIHHHDPTRSVWDLCSYWSDKATKLQSTPRTWISPFPAYEFYNNTILIKIVILLYFKISPERLWLLKMQMDTLYSFIIVFSTLWDICNKAGGKIDIKRLVLSHSLPTIYILFVDYRICFPMSYFAFGCKGNNMQRRMTIGVHLDISLD